MFIPNYFNIKIILYLKKSYINFKKLKKKTKKKKFNFLLISFLSTPNLSLINLWYTYLKFLIFKKFIKKKKNYKKKFIKKYKLKFKVKLKLNKLKLKKFEEIKKLKKFEEIKKLKKFEEIKKLKKFLLPKYKKKPLVIQEYIKQQKFKKIILKKKNYKKLKKLIKKQFKFIRKKNKLNKKINKKLKIHKLKNYDLILKLIILPLLTGIKKKVKNRIKLKKLKFTYKKITLDIYKFKNLYSLLKINYIDYNFYKKLKKYFFKKKINSITFFSHNLNKFMYVYISIFTKNLIKNFLKLNKHPNTTFHSLKAISIIKSELNFKKIHRINLNYKYYYDIYKFNLVFKENNSLNKFLSKNLRWKSNIKIWIISTKNVKFKRRKKGFRKYFKINIKRKKKFLKISYNRLFLINYTARKNKNILLKKNSKTLSKKIFYKIIFQLKFLPKLLNKLFFLRKKAQPNKIYLYNYLYKKNKKILKKTILTKYQKIKQTKKLSNEFNFAYKFINKESLNNYIKLKYVIKSVLKNKYINVINYLLLIKKKKKIHNIFNCMFLNKTAISHFFVKFFKYTKDFNYNESNDFIHRKKKKKNYFFNSWQGLLITWKQAREYHWNLYNKHKKLKKRRYRNFLPPFLKRNKIIQEIIINYFSFKFNFSNIFWNIFTNMYLYFYNKSIKKKEIFQIPINILFWIFLKVIKQYKLKIKKKINLWLKKNWKIKKTFWMAIKKKIPKYFLKQTYKIQGLKNVIQYDFITNYFCILKEKNSYVKINNFIFYNKLLKLHNIRYKA